jgi:hypothetical protein
VIQKSVIQITFATLKDFIDEHKKYGYPDRSIVRAQVTEDPNRPGGYEVVVTSLQRGQILRYNAHPEVHEDAEAEQTACSELRKELAAELVKHRFEVREGILGVAEA